jgi:hypothetical protein
MGCIKRWPSRAAVGTAHDVAIYGEDCGNVVALHDEIFWLLVAAGDGTWWMSGIL